MKSIKFIFSLGVLLVLASGCQTTTQEYTQDKALIEQEAYNDIEESSENTNNMFENANNNIENEKDIIEVTEKMYVTYINDIYTNFENYEGKKIRIQGIFTSFYDETVDETFYFVYRTGPGCCGNDGAMCGFEFTTSGEIPTENDWIEVTGVLTSYEQDGVLYLMLKDSTVEIKQERGLEVVYQ